MTSPEATVLFVDDEPTVLQAIRRSLSRSALTVLTAESAARAFVLLEEHAVDVIVSDIDMPGMDGIEFVRIARERYPDTLRMFLTGAATLERALDAINEGEVLRFFRKPFDVHAFRTSIEGLAQRIARLRVEGAEAARRQRRDRLIVDLAGRFPDVLSPADRDEEGNATIDLDVLERSLVDLPELRALVARRKP